MKNVGVLAVDMAVGVLVEKAKGARVLAEKVKEVRF